MTVSKLLHRLTFSIALASLYGIGATAQTATAGTNAKHEHSTMGTHSTGRGMTAADKTFMKKAAQGGMAEVELGRLATERASNPDVKKFGQRMVDDHTQANNQLKELASSMSLTLPNSLDAKDEMTKKKLSSLSGAEFDKAYMSDMVRDHTKDVSDFRQESMSSKDEAVKSFAQQTLPTLQDHLKEARRIAPEVQGNMGTRSSGTR